MENKGNINDSTLNSFYKSKNSKKKVSKKNLVQIKSIYLSKTFASKLFIQLCRDVIDPIIICLQTLKYEPENRKREEIESTIPYLRTLEHFNNFVNLFETPNSSFELMAKFAKITYYHYFPKNSIVKRPGESNDSFFIILNGEVCKYNLIFEVENLTVEQYILYLVELELINEYEIINKCFALNKDIIDIDHETNEASLVEKLVKKSDKYNYKELQQKAKKVLIKLGFNSRLYKSGKLRKVPNKESYLKIFENMKSFSNDEGRNKFRFYVGKYKLSTLLAKGQYFNYISDINLNENGIYICETNSDLGRITREEFIKNKLDKSINNKMRQLFSKVKNNFFSLKGIPDEKFWDEYMNSFLYKKYKRHDKIFIQGECYNGMYLILDGNISLYSNSSVEKLCNLLFSIVTSIKSFSEYIPSFNVENIIQEFNNMHQLLYKSAKISHEESITKKTIDISVQKTFDILGFCELYDSKTELYNFTAECLSESATLLFIPRNNLNLILSKELTFYNNIIDLVEIRIIFIVGKFKSFVNQLMATYKLNMKKNFSLEKFNISQNRNNKIIISSINNANNNKRNLFTQYNKRNTLNDNIFNNKFFNKLNDNEKKTDTMYNYPNLQNYRYYESLNNFKRELNRKKKLAEEMSLIKKNSIFYKNSLGNFSTPKITKPISLETKLLDNNILIISRNKKLNREKMQRIQKSVDFNTNNINQINNYFSLTTIGLNSNNNTFYQKNIRNRYKAFPKIINQRKIFTINNSNY